MPAITMIGRRIAKTIGLKEELFMAAEKSTADAKGELEQPCPVNGF
jgi:hypothetical protein